ncbi:MAG: hypothetical protein ACKOPS_17790, partial [Cyanobium sp.]
MERAFATGGAIAHMDADGNVFGAGLGVFNLHVVVVTAFKHPGIKQLILECPATASLVLIDKILVGIDLHRIFIEAAHVGMRRRAVEIKIIFLDVLAVITLIAREAEKALLEDRIPAVPQGQSKAELLADVADAENAIFPPAIGPGARLVMGKVFPGRAIGAVVLAHRAPLAVAEIGPPALPVLAAFGVVKQP